MTALPIYGIAEPNPLIGTWQSDHEKTMDFIRKNTKITGKQYEFSDQIFGKMKVIFTKDKTCSWIPDWQFNGKAMQGWKDTKWRNYVVLDVSKDRVITSGPDPLRGKPDFIRYSFEGPDTMWIYTGYDVTLHAREYFKRIPTPVIIPCKTSDVELDMGSDTHPKQE